MADTYPLPRIDDILSRLSENRFYSKIDLSSGYYQISMDPESRKYTAFVCEFGLFEYVAMPMGLKNACATFQRLMDHVLKDLIGVACYVYMDDIIVFGKDVNEHCQRVHQIVERLRVFELKIKSKKCEFLQEEN